MDFIEVSIGITEVPYFLDLKDICYLMVALVITIFCFSTDGKDGGSKL